MNEAATIATWDVLKGFGFVPELGTWSDIQPGLCFDFGNFKLSAIAIQGKGFRPVVRFTGHLFTPRTFAEVCFELPRTVASKELLAAFIVYYLDHVADGGVFHPKRGVEWIAIGREHSQLLPWEVSKAAAEVSRAAYQARPCCIVDRDWWRMAQKNIAEIAANAPDQEPVIIEFDGRILTITCSGEVVALAGDGNPWPTRYSIPATKFRSSQKRIMQAWVEISVWEAQLRIGSRLFSGVTDADCR